jgi:enoyl-[acyl-carrier protein] reductase I
MLANRACAVFGFASTRSIAWGIAEAWSAAGASLTIGVQSERFLPALRAATSGWPAPPHAVVCDVASDADIEAAFLAIGAAHGGRLHAVAHSVAFAPSRAMRAPLLDTARDDFLAAHSVSAFSLLALSRGALPLLRAAGGGSVVALSYLGATRAARNYRVMGAAKASLEACARGLAVELAPERVRVNVISPGPVNTLAARGIESFTVRGRGRAVGENRAGLSKTRHTTLPPPSLHPIAALFPRAGAARGHRGPRAPGARRDAQGGGRSSHLSRQRRRRGDHRANALRGRRLQRRGVTAPFTPQSPTR